MITRRYLVISVSLWEMCVNPFWSPASDGTVDLLLLLPGFETLKNALLQTRDGIYISVSALQRAEVVRIVQAGSSAPSQEPLNQHCRVYGFTIMLS